MYSLRNVQKIKMGKRQANTEVLLEATAFVQVFISTLICTQASWSYPTMPVL